MFVEPLLAAAFQVGPFYEQKTDYAALRPLWASEGQTTDVVWPLFTAHRDWWRCFYIFHYQEYPEDGYQFDVLPIWWNGSDEQGEDYAGLFPLGGYHPHFLAMYDVKFALWPLWHQYRRPRDHAWLETNSVLFPFFHWRSDGSWGAWPIYGVNHQRESDHRYALWPICTWANYRFDRDTAGAGYSWMVWPLWASVDREREQQSMFLPPLFAYAETAYSWRLRCPWPLLEFERGIERDRSAVFPFYEHVALKTYGEHVPSSSVTRFGWRLIEFYDDETRVFPFWTSRRDGSYFRLWPFWESETVRNQESIVKHSRLFCLFPIRWVPAVSRNWAKFWTFYESSEDVCSGETHHSLLWGIIPWTTGGADK